MPRPTPSDSRPRLFGIRPALALALLLGAGTTSALAQTAKKAAGPVPYDPKPLARYVAKDKLFFYLENNGFASQEEAWKKTAASKMLTETTLGEMMELMAKQAFDQTTEKSAGRKMNGTDLVTVVEHATQHGFVIALHQGEDQAVPFHVTAVFKGGAAKEVRASFGRLMGTLMEGSKPAIVKVGARSIIEFASKSPTSRNTWWTEQNDLVVSLAGTPELVTNTLDGKTPNAVDHPSRADLFRAETGGFTPVAGLFIDPTLVSSSANSGFASLVQTLGQTLDAQRIDVRFGFHDDALMTVTRIKSPRPHRGVLAYLDQPAFDPTKLPPLPVGSEAFTVLSLNPSVTLDLLLNSVASGPIKDVISDIKTKTKLDLKKDILSHLGPRMSVFVLPGSGTAAGAGAGAGGGGMGLPSLGAGGPMGIMSALFTASSGGQIPKMTIMMEVDDPTTFGKTFDNMMIAINKILKEKMAPIAEAARDNPPGGGGRGMMPGGMAAGDAPGPGGGGNPNRRAPVALPDFQPMPGRDNEKIYNFRVPTAMANQIPAGLRPSIRLSGKYLVISTTPDGAKQAVELKAGAWTPPGDLAGAFATLPKDLVGLYVTDTRDTVPDSLASLPAGVQKLVNTVDAASKMKPATPPAGEAPGGGNPEMAGGPGMGGSRGGGNFRPGAGMAMGGGGSMMPGMPGGPGMGGGGNPSGSGTSLLRFKIDAAKLPKADDLRSKMFPSSLAIASGDQDVTIVSRAAFPNVNLSGGSVASSAIGLSYVLPMIQPLFGGMRKALGLPDAPATPPGDEAANNPPGGGRAPGSLPGGMGAGGPIPPGEPGGGSMPGMPGGPGGRPGGGSRPR